MKNKSRLKFEAVRGEVYVFLQSDLPLEWPQTAYALLSYFEPLQDLTQSMEVIFHQWRAANGCTSLAVKAIDNTNMAGWSWRAVFTTKTRFGAFPPYGDIRIGMSSDVTVSRCKPQSKQLPCCCFLQECPRLLLAWFFFYSNVGQQSLVYIFLYMWPKVIKKGKNNLNMESYR